MKLVVASAIAASIVISGVSTADAEVEQKNDSFVDGSIVAVQGGFAPGEIAAARFNVASPRQLLKVRLIFANELSGGQARDVTLHAWADSQSGNNPGQELYSGDFTLMPSQTAMQELNVTGDNISVKARFDEENNMREAQRLQRAGCFVIYGVNSLKTHTKLMLIVRKDLDDKVYRYVHLSSGNYNESTSRLYVDIGLLTTREVYGNDVSEFFNVITGHSQPSSYRNLITSPRDMRIQLCNLVRKEADNARNGIPSGIVIKLNSMQDKQFIDEQYAASQAGVKIKLIIRGMCCIRPGRKGE